MLTGPPEGGERSEDGGAQGESENTPISSSRQQEAEKLIEKDIENQLKSSSPLAPTNPIGTQLVPNWHPIGVGLVGAVG